MLVFARSGVIATADTPRRVAGGVLQRLADVFAQAGHAKQAAVRREGGLQCKFGPTIKQVVEFGNGRPEAFDEVARVAAEAEEVREIVVDNIDKLLERGERIQSLATKTDQLEAQAAQFQKVSNQLHRQLWWQNKKMVAVLVCSALLVLLSVALITTGALGYLPGFSPR